jgi:predicted transcriptional regulator
MIDTVMRYRSRTEIIVSILEAARFGDTKTKIMYSSFLSSHPLRTYLEVVISNGLLAYDSTKGRYRTTEKGLRLLDLYDNVGRLELPRELQTTLQPKSRKERYYASNRKEK